MKKTNILFAIFFMIVCISGCNANESVFKEYKNEVSYEEFISSIETDYINSGMFLDLYMETDFYYSYYKESQSSEKIEIKYDKDCEVVMCTSTVDGEVVFDSIIEDDKDFYLSRPEGMLNIFFSNDVENKYYIDEGVYTIVFPYDPNAFTTNGDKIKRTVIYQAIIESNSITVINAVESKETNEQYTQLTIEELVKKDINLIR